MSGLYSAMWTGFAHLTKILAGFIVLKLVAVYLGAEGLGSLGQLMSLITILSLIAGGGITNGVIKYVAAYKILPPKMLHFVSGAFSYASYFSVALLVICLFFSGPLAKVIMGDVKYFWIIILVGFAQYGFALTNLIVGVVNGLKETRVFAIIQIVGGFLAIPVAWALIAKFGWNGAVIALCVIVVSPLLPGIMVFFKSSFKGQVKLLALRQLPVKLLAPFSLMLFTSAVAFPVVEMVVRNYLITSEGYHQAGLWQGAIKLSSAYLGFFSMFLGYYFMPMISEQHDKKVIARLVFRYLAFVMLLFILGGTVLYVGRSFFLVLALSSDFKELEELIIYQLAGDFFRISAYVIGYVAVAKAATKLYVVAEFFQSIVFLGAVFTASFLYNGVQGVMLGYMATYIIYFIVCVVGFWIYLGKSVRRLE